MDKKTIREFLETVGEVEDTNPVSSSTIRVDPNSSEVVKYNGEWVEIKAKDNPTLGFKFVKLKPISRICELGCGKVVEDQIVERKHYAWPEPHWRTSCKSCKCTVSPDGQSFIKGGTQAQAAFCRWLSGNKE